MSLFTIFFSLQSLIFFIGINFISKKIVAILYLDKSFRLLIFSNFVLLIAFCFYFLNSTNFYYLENFCKITYFSLIFIGYFELTFKLNKFSKKNEKKIFKWNYINIIYFLILANILIASIVPVTDADSIRYHLGQFNNLQKFSEFDLHSKISYIGDGLNIISYYSNSLNLISCLNYYYLFYLITLIKKNFINEKKILFSLFLLSIPIYLNLLISQKPFIWLIFNLFYIFFLNYKNLIKKNSIIIFITLLNLSLIQIAKPEFLLIVPAFLIFLFISMKLNLIFFKRNNFKKIGFLILSLLIFPVIFYIYNYIIYLDPTKILLVQNNIGEENFVSFLKNSNMTLSFENIFEFFLNLGIPIKFTNYFSISLGLGFFICVIFSRFSLNKNYIFLIFLILLNLIFFRVNIEEHHSRNYLIIFLILIYLFLQKKILYGNLIKVILILQLIITQISFLYFNYEIYVKNNYNNIAYNYKNENTISEQIVVNKNSIIISNIDGNLFKKYDYVNIDYYNFNEKFFFESLKQRLKKDQKIENIILIFKDKNLNPYLNQYYNSEIDLIFRTRNPLKKEKTVEFKIYSIPKKKFINLKNPFF